MANARQILAVVGLSGILDAVILPRTGCPVRFIAKESPCV